MTENLRSSPAFAAHPVEAVACGWQPIETAPKDGSFIWLSDGFFMRVGYWYVVTRDPSQEHWSDMLRAEGGHGDLQWEPKYWQPVPLPPVQS